jgi:SAM-dependent methyltransferase
VYLSQRIPLELKRSYRRWATNLIGDRPRIKEIDLRRTLIGGEGNYDAGHWADVTGDMERASTVLKDSPHVTLLEQYLAVGEKLFLWETFGETSYFKNSAQCVQICKDYFGHRSREGILQQARSFAATYEQIKNGNGSQVRLTFEQSPLPLVRETLTTNTFQIVDGHHRLAIAWALGQQKAKAIVLSPPMPTALQSLVLTVHHVRALYHPIDRPQFDSSWERVRRCDDRLAMMLRFLSSTGHKLDELSVVDLGCCYGWFVSEFSKRGCRAIGIDRDPAALKIGRIAYGLHSEQLIQTDIMAFLRGCNRTFDVVLLLSILQDFAQRPDFGNPEEVLKRIDAITGSYLFLETGQNHEQWYRNVLSQWGDDFIINLIRQHTSFNHVLPLGVGSDNVGPYRNNYARTLFVCFRSGQEAG